MAFPLKMTFDAESYVSKSPKSPVAEDNDGDGLDESRTQREVKLWMFFSNDHG
jgi:hypothetical protein